MQPPTALYADLGFAVFERIATHVFKPVGQLPCWWRSIGQLDPGNLFVPSSQLVFLHGFLDDAAELWSQAAPQGRLGSAIWELSDDDRSLYVQILALRSGGLNWLVFHNIESTGDGLRAQLQAGRNSQLERMRDVARRQQLEIELRDAHQVFEKLERARNSFMANVSHELRTPLMTILGMVELLKEADALPQQTDIGKSIERSAQGLLRLVNDILDMSKYEAGVVELECQDVNVSEFVDDVRRDFERAAEQKGIAFIVTLAESTPKAVWQDPLRLRQVFNNLIDNAIRFTDRGSVTVTIGPDEEQFDCLRVSVTDTGVGIARDHHEVIFDSFIRVDASSTREYGGTGLGLAIANKLVGVLGGSLQLESIVGEGSKFTFVVPFVAEQSRTKDASPDALVAMDDGDLDGLTILVAEDNAVNRRYIRHVVEKAQAKVVEADNGQRALDLLCEQDFDAAIMDCQMPVLDGLAVTAMIRLAETKIGGHLPIIAVTAHAMKQDIDHCLSVGMDEYLSKPFQAAELRAAIRRVVQKKAASVAGVLSEVLLKQQR